MRSKKIIITKKELEDTRKLYNKLHYGTEKICLENVDKDKYDKAVYDLAVKIRKTIEFFKG